MRLIISCFGTLITCSSAYGDLSSSPFLNRFRIQSTIVWKHLLRMMASQAQILLYFKNEERLVGNSRLVDPEMHGRKKDGQTKEESKAHRSRPGDNLFGFNCLSSQMKALKKWLLGREIALSPLARDWRSPSSKKISIARPTSVSSPTGPGWNDS